MRLVPQLVSCLSELLVIWSAAKNCEVGCDLEGSEDGLVCQAVLVTPKHVGHLTEALLTHAQLPQTEG